MYACMSEDIELCAGCMWILSGVRMCACTCMFLTSATCLSPEPAPLPGDLASAVGTVSPGLALRPQWSGSSLFSLLPLCTWLTHHAGRAGP